MLLVCGGYSMKGNANRRGESLQRPQLGMNSRGKFLTWAYSAFGSRIVVVASVQIDTDTPSGIGSVPTITRMKPARE